jgi:pimeloyl-ACP methyl ester carboxylesterase
LSILLTNSFILAQNAKTPYPIILVHGLNSNADTWEETVDAFGGSAKILDVCLNNDDGNHSTSLIDNDVAIVGWRDNDTLTPSPNRLYTINFDNEQMTGHESHNFSNQSAIYKQGLAIKYIISLVRGLENSEKVILVGHSMGGLAIREYLQRVENGSRKWWIDPSDDEYGHKVAKVVTIGTPHLGSNVANIEIPFPFWVPNLRSEAVRDLRYNYDLFGSSPPSSEDNGVYLYGGYENNGGLSSYYNQDINCNGSNDDQIIGINSPNIPGNYNILQPLPQNLDYTWIVSKNGSGGDGIVRDDRQYIYNIGDSINTHVNHLNEPSDYEAILRGLDEPENITLAYQIANNAYIKGHLTYQKYYDSTDTDLFKIIISNYGELVLVLNAEFASGVKRISILESNGSLRIEKNVSTWFTTISENLQPGTYYIKIVGNARNVVLQERTYVLSTLFKELNLLSNFLADKYLVGSNTTIEWNSSNIQNIKIELSTDNGINWSTIVESIQASLGSYDWTIPNTPSEECLMRISDVTNTSNYDMSDEVFSILQTSFVMSSPNGGENWSANSSKKIKWIDRIGIAENIRLELTTDNGANWIAITETTPANTLEYNWTVNNLISDVCKIKITDIDNLSDFDLSDNLFTISSQNFWSTNPNAANPICTAYWQQLEQKIVSDGAGGAIIVWADGRSGNWDDIYAQKINSKGVIQWAINGNSVRSKLGLFYPSNDFTAVSDGNGGAIVVWCEAYSPGGFITYHYIKAQKISAAGNLEWNTDGIPICTASLDRKNVNIVSDGSGGAIITWVDSRNGNWDIFTQRINSSGTTLWQSDGIAICTAVNNQDRPTVIGDGIGGGIIKWEDNQSGSVSIYAQRINSSGDVQWVPDGVVICSMSVSSAQGAAPPMINDNAGGAIVAWADTRNGINIYAQRINSTGNVQWVEGGVPLGVAYTHANPQMISDGNEGTIITWVYGYIKLKAQKMNSNGVVQWESGGITLFDGFVISGEIESDYSGGAIISFNKHISYNTPPYSSLAAKRINSDGNVLWNNEFNTSKGPSNQKMIYDGSGGVIVAFLDIEASSSSNDIYTSKINSAGELGGDNIPLPIELVSFIALTSNNGVVLNWQTATEVNNYGFEIERKAEKETWLTIGFVEGNGNSNSKKEYSFKDDNLPFGNIVYRLKQIDTDGKFEYSHEIKINIDIPTKFALIQNYPNPFNPSTKIKYSIPKSDIVHIKVYDILGKEIQTLLNEYKQAGTYEVKFDASDLTSGVYFYKIICGSYIETKKMIVLR